MNRTLLIEDEASGFSLTITEDCDALRDLIDDVDRTARDEGADEVRDEVRDQFERYFSPREVLGSDRDWLELSAAIARGDTSEAAFLLDRIAERFGLEAVEQVQRGRYSQRGQAGRAV